MAARRDPDKALAYEAEDLVWVDTLFAESMGGGVATLAQKIVEHPWWVEAHRGLSPEIVPARREAQSSFAYGSRAVRLALGGENAWVLTHELAHSIASHHNSGVGHDRGWRTAYVDLARLVAGTEMSEALRRSFESRGLAVDTATPYTPAPDVSDFGLYELHRLDEFRGAIA